MQMFWHVPVLSLLSCCLHLEKMKHICQYESKDPGKKGPWLQPARALPGVSCRVRNSHWAFSSNFTSKAPPTCCIAVFPLLATKCFFLARLSIVPLLYFCCLVLTESSSSVCKEPDFCQRCHQKFHLLNACMSPELLPKFCPFHLASSSGQGWHWCVFGFY